jgi:hypothetical protein
LAFNRAQIAGTLTEDGERVTYLTKLRSRNSIKKLVITVAERRVPFVAAAYGKLVNEAWELLVTDVNEHKFSAIAIAAEG